MNPVPLTLSEQAASTIINALVKQALPTDEIIGFDTSIGMVPTGPQGQFSPAMLFCLLAANHAVLGGPAFMALMPLAPLEFLSNQANADQAVEAGLNNLREQRAAALTVPKGLIR